VIGMAILGTHDDLDLIELIEKLTLAFPEEVAEFEARYQDVWAAVLEDDLNGVDLDDLDDLRSDLTQRLDA
jgi:hypothetical protein